MIYNRLEEKINTMKDLKRRETIKANKAEQDAIDQKYRSLVLQTHQFIEAVVFTNQSLKFVLGNDSITDIKKLCEGLSRMVRSGFADKSTVVTSEETLKRIQVPVKRDWTKHYSTLTDTTISILNVISGIDAEKVNACLAQIKCAEAWTIDLKNYQSLITGINTAKSLIQSLGLDQEIIEFLQKMNNGKATVSDLNEKVLAWIRDENMASRIYLSFSKGMMIRNKSFFN